MWPRLRTICLLLVAIFFLSGCVSYDVGINVWSQTQGEIVQHIQLGEQLTSFSDAVAQAWLQSIQQRSRELGGRTRRISAQELAVRIPFNSGAELAEKFNAFFQPVPQQASSDRQAGIPNLRSQLHLSQSNFLLVERDRLSLNVDLRPLDVIAAKGSVLISPGDLLTLQFHLTAPWGVRRVSAPDAVQQGNQILWKLKPGADNHLEAVFWVPSPLGIGTVAIALLVIAGIYLRTQLFPGSLPPHAEQPGSIG